MEETDQVIKKEVIDWPWLDDALDEHLDEHQGEPELDAGP